MDVPSSSPVQTQAKRYVGIYLAIVFVILAFTGGVFTGRAIAPGQQDTDENGRVEISRVININRSLNKSDAVDFEQFWEVWDAIKTKHVKQPVKDVDLFYGAIQGMVFALNDPYSMYFPPQAAEDFDKSLRGEFSGIGAEVGVKDQQLVVITPLPNTPAEKAGLKPADKILAIDAKSTLGMDVGTAVEHIRGSATSSVVLTILREGWSESKDFTIHRAKIRIPAILFNWKPGNVAYIRVMQFNDSTMPALNTHIKDIKNRKASGIVLDLRNNPGGYLETAVALTSEWIQDGPIVRERLSDGKETAHDSIGLHRLSGIRTVVLVNGGSASASEIVAGALQDYKAATLLGEKTFGKGSVQDVVGLPDGSALKLTIAEWLTPNGNNINEKGIVPDVALKEDYEKEKVGEDMVVDKALELLKK